MWAVKSSGSAREISRVRSMTFSKCTAPTALNGKSRATTSCMDSGKARMNG